MFFQTICHPPVVKFTESKNGVEKMHKQLALRYRKLPYIFLNSKTTITKNSNGGFFLGGTK